MENHSGMNINKHLVYSAEETAGTQQIYLNQIMIIHTEIELFKMLVIPYCMPLSLQFQKYVMM